jgi:cation:H+ antiporter
VEYFFLFGGLIYLLMGGDLLVRGAVALARRARVPPVIIALSVVAFGTSLPELVVTLRSVLTGYPGIGIGNVVGSNIANVFLVVGVPAIVYPLVTAKEAARRDASAMVGVTVLFVVLSFLGDFGRLQGLLLLAVLAVLLGLTARETARRREGDTDAPIEWVLGLPHRPWMIALFIVFGAIFMPLGARMLIESAVHIAAQLQISDAVAGLTLVAVSTSLPELATAFVAALRRQSGVAIGTAMGSNIFNIVAIMGVTATVSPDPIVVPHGFRTVDLPVMLAASLLLALFVWRRRPIARLAGVTLVVGYGLYLLALFAN